MVQITGTYQLQSQENQKEYLETLGLKGEQLEKIVKLSESIDISTADEHQITVSLLGKQVTFPFNKEVEHALDSDHNALTIASQNGNVFTFKSKLNADGSVTEERVITVTDNGLTAVITNNKGGKCVRTYKRS